MTFKTFSLYLHSIDDIEEVETHQGNQSKKNTRLTHKSGVSVKKNRAATPAVNSELEDEDV